MRPSNWLSAIMCSAVLALPAVVLADRDQGGRDGERWQGGSSGNCYEHKGKVKCHGDKGNNGYGRGNSQAGGPPPWAPAHGWRSHEDGGDYRRAAQEDERSDARVAVSRGPATVDVGIQHGTCNREVIATVVGGVIGGVIGNQVGDAKNRDVATILGVVIGGVVGHEVGRSMDKSDQQCTGQALEQATDHQVVRWADKAQRGEYSVTPERTYQTSDGRYCRDYTAEYQGPNGVEREQASACRTEEGAWKRVVM